MDNDFNHEEKWIVELNKGRDADIDSVADEVFDSKCSFYITGKKEKEYVELLEFKKMVMEDLVNLPGRRFSVEDQIPVGDKNLFVFRWSAESACSILQGGEPIRIEGLIIDKMANGRVVERWEQWDQPALDDFKGLAMYKKYFGHKFEGKRDGLREFTINHLFAHIYSRSSKISWKERCMITIALLALQRREKQLESHMKAACHLEISKEKILEIMNHVGDHAGSEAKDFGKHVVAEENTDKRTKSDKLTERERCMITVSLLAAQGREDQLKEQMKEAQDSGITWEQMLEIAIHVAHYAGWPTGNFIQGIALEVYEGKSD